jgi:hypothetical protein
VAEDPFGSGLSHAMVEAMADHFGRAHGRRPAGEDLALSVTKFLVTVEMQAVPPKVRDAISELREALREFKRRTIHG